MDEAILGYLDGTKSMAVEVSRIWRQLADARIDVIGKYLEKNLQG